MMTSLARDECEEVVRRLWPHLDGVLPATEQDRVARHLVECGACRSHFEFARAFLDAVQRAQVDQVHVADLRERVLAALAEQGYKGPA